MRIVLFGLACGTALLLGCPVITAELAEEKTVLPPKDTGSPQETVINVVIAISPEAPTTGDDLEVVILTESVTPPQDEPMTYTYEWFRGNTAQTDLDTALVPAEHTAKNETWKVFLTPTTGTLQAGLVSAEVTVINSPPEVDTLEVSPESPGTTADIVATATAIDADEDAVSLTYAWSLPGTSRAVSGSTLAASETTRGETWMMTVAPNDGEEDGAPETLSVTIENTAPVATASSLSPDPAVTTDTLSATAEGEDADGDAITWSYAFAVDNTVVQEGEANTLVPEFFAKAQEVTVAATPSDDTDAGTALESAVLTIANTPPSMTDVALDPQVIFEATTVTCTPSGWSDADGDSEDYTYTWSVGGTDPGVTTAELSGTDFDKNDEIACSATPIDSEDAGVPLTSAAVTVSNTAPTLGSATLSSTSPQKADVVSVSLTGEQDDDGDTVTYVYAWSVDGAVVSGASTLTGLDFDKGDSIFVEVTPTDEEDPGIAITSDTATAVNTPPTVDSLSLTPQAALYTNDLMSAITTLGDVDPADTPTAEFAWYVDGQQVAETSDVLDGATFFEKGDPVYVVVTPTDGTETGATATSSTLTVLNTPPTAPGISVSPTEPEPGVHDLVCTVDTVSNDADGDAVTYGFAWDVDGTAFTSVTGTSMDSTVGTADIDYGQTWTCTVTPDDGLPGSAATASATIQSSDTTGQWLAVDAGGSTDPLQGHTCAIDLDGTLHCWGQGTTGTDCALSGNHDCGQADPPAGSFTEVDAGNAHTCATDTQGALHCWGWNFRSDLNAPSGTGYHQVGAGGHSSCAIDSTNHVQCWGNNVHGQLDAPTIEVSRLAVGINNNCVLDTTGAIQCWGYDHYNMVSSAPGGSGFLDISGDAFSFCAIDANSELVCWGDNTYAQSTPPGGTYEQISVGTYHACAISTAGTLSCWGMNDDGQTNTPTGRFDLVAAGHRHTCAVTTAGQMQCWGNNTHGEATAPPDNDGDGWAEGPDCDDTDATVWGGSSPCPECTSLEFDGSGDYVEVAHNSDLSFAGSDYTFEWWFLLDGAAGGSVLGKRGGSNGSGYDIDVRDDRLVAANGCCGGGDSMYFNTQGHPQHDEVASGWHHVALTHDAQNTASTFWLDGIAFADTTNYLSLGANTQSVWFGRERLNGGFSELTLGGIQLSDAVLYSTSFTPVWPLVSNADTVSLWTMEEGGGSTLSDSSGNAYDGTIHGSAAWSTSCPGEDLDGDGYATWEDCDDTDATVWGGASPCSECAGLNFDGVDDYVEVSDHNQLDLRTNMTVSTWVRLESGGQGSYPNFLVGKGLDASNSYAWAMSLAASGPSDRVLWHLNDGSNNPTASTTTTLEVGRWYHVAGTYDGTQLKVYLNGVLEDTIATSLDPGNQSSPVVLGVWPNNSWYLNGDLSHMALYDSALSDSEISALMTSGVDHSDARLVAWWPLYDGSGSTLNDASGNNHSGTIHGSAAWSTSCPAEDRDGDSYATWEDCDDSDSNLTEVECIDGNTDDWDYCSNDCQWRSRWYPLLDSNNTPSQTSRDSLGCLDDHALWFGDCYSGQQTSVLEEDASGNLAWTELGVLSPAPVGRCKHAVAYHAGAGHAVMYGGDGFGTRFGDPTWTWDGTSWSSSSHSTTPDARSHAGIVYDSVREEVLLYAGDDDSDTLSDLWAWDGSSWSEYTGTSGPSDRRHAGMAQDPVTGDVLVFGGNDWTSNYNAETWSWDGTSWTQLTPATSPSERAVFRSMVYDTHSEAITLIGGYNHNTGGSFADTWIWDGTNWIERFIDAPSISDGAACELASANGIVSVGKTGTSNTVNETWILTTPPNAPYGGDADGNGVSDDLE